MTRRRQTVSARGRARRAALRRVPARSILLRSAGAGATLLLLACPPREASDSEDPARPASARPELAEALRLDREAPRHAADGGGRAWLHEPSPATAGRGGSWEIRYEAGPLGIAEGGSLYLQVSPFWGWSTPQVSSPGAPGFTRVETEASGLELAARTLDQQLLGIEIRGRALRPGEEIRLLYGAGEAGARADRFAERGSRFWISVDGDGDGVRGLLADSPAVDVGPGPAARLVLTLPSTARPGERVRLTVAVLDPLGNAGIPFAGEVRLEARLDGAEEPLPVPELSEPLSFAPEALGRRTISFRVGSAGVLRILGRSEAGLAAESNPLQASERGARVLWGDLQNHSGFSDGTALPEDFFLYARDVAALDVVSLTDHDHWGLPFLDQSPPLWQGILAETRRFHEPGRFVTLPGYEWTSWIWGHRHVLFFEAADAELYSSLDETTDTPRELWAALAGKKAMTVAHHPAGGPIATDWSIPPDPRFEPVTEIVSVHGSSEAPDSPRAIYRPVAGAFVRDALARGYQLGFLGSSDGHDGHPGLAHLASPSGGLAAILAEEATREAVYEALAARRVYATSGPRILLRASYGGHRMGEEISLAAGGLPGASIPPHTLVAQALAPGAIERVDVIRSGEVTTTVDCEGERSCGFSLHFDDLSPDEYLYLRLVQTDGHLALSSPFYFRE